MPVTQRQVALAAQFRAHFLRIMAPWCERPIFLSGGVDSATILAASLALGARPTCYSFRLGEQDSRDVAVARRMTVAHHVPHIVVNVPRNQEQLILDVKRVLKIIGVPTKTHVQCSHPFLYLSTAVVADGFSQVLMGMAAGDLWGDSREAAIAYHEDGNAGHRAYRLHNWRNPTNSEGSVNKVITSVGLAVTDPYFDQELGDWLLGLSYADMHHGKQKALAVYAFTEFWRAGAFYRTNSNLQINSGLREFHDTLLQSAVNTRSSRAIVAIYRDLLERLKYEREIEQQSRPCADDAALGL